MNQNNINNKFIIKSKGKKLENLQNVYLKNRSISSNQATHRPMSANQRSAKINQFNQKYNNQQQSGNSQQQQQYDQNMQGGNSQKRFQQIQNNPNLNNNYVNPNQDFENYQDFISNQQQQGIYNQNNQSNQNNNLKINQFNYVNYLDFQKPIPSNKTSDKSWIQKNLQAQHYWKIQQEQQIKYDQHIKQEQEKKIEGQQEQIKTLEENEKQQQQQFNSLSLEIEKYKLREEKLKQDIEFGQKRYNTDIGQRDKQIEDLNKLFSNMKQVQEELINQKKICQECLIKKQQIEDLYAKNRELENQIKDLKFEIKSIESEKNKFEQKIKDFDSQINQQNTDIQDKNEEIENLKNQHGSKLQHLENLVQSQKDEIADKDQNLSKLNEELLQKIELEDEISRLKQQILELQDIQEQQKLEISVQDKEATKQQGEEVERQKKQIKDLELQVKDEISMNETLEEQIKEMEQQIEQLQKQQKENLSVIEEGKENQNGNSEQKKLLLKEENYESGVRNKKEFDSLISEILDIKSESNLEIYSLLTQKIPLQSKLFSKEQSKKLFDSIYLTGLEVYAIQLIQKYTIKNSPEDVIRWINQQPSAYKNETLEIITPTISSNEFTMASNILNACYKYEEQEDKDQVKEILSKGKPWNPIFGNIQGKYITFIIDFGKDQEEIIQNYFDEQMTRKEYIKLIFIQIITQQIQESQNFNIIANFEGQQQFWKEDYQIGDANTVEECQNWIQDLNMEKLNLVNGLKNSLEKTIDEPSHNIYILSDGINEEKQEILDALEKGNEKVQVNSCMFLYGIQDQGKEEKDACKLMHEICIEKKGCYRVINSYSENKLDYSISVQEDDNDDDYSQSD